MSEALSRQLAALPPELRAELSRHRFDEARLLSLASNFLLGRSGAETNRVGGVVAPPSPGDLGSLPELGSAERARLEERGLAALARGEAALCVLAGGMATRMGGVVKALVEALPGRTFLELRLREREALAARVGRAAPLWLMSSHASDAPLRAALGARSEGDRVAVFTQDSSLRLTRSGALHLDARGAPSLYACGHGDLPGALRASGLLERFVARGGRTVLVANLDNLGAGLDPAILGWHLEHGAPATCEVVEKVGADRGGIPVRLDGRLVVLEEFRLPRGFEPDAVRVFNTNTFHFDARALLEAELEFTWFSVEKQVEESTVIQFERLIGEVTSSLETRFLMVPRVGAQSRFLPVKDTAELSARREALEVLARARGMVP
ncbi:MAG: UTP--glucose-1-phosphate uridylyltransferase [Sorangiineae bacterium]|nr:UTP--glucose-1-phosphate uridylyltransferase [Polyangiaceae bacterium]MEB2324916.1 UTP--glucose-1-phosphate uridylyltransferase [Sorangiineae bacterium]